MYVDVVQNRGSRPTVLLRESYREGKRTLKRTLANITKWPAEKIDMLDKVLKSKRVMCVDEMFVKTETCKHGHVDLVLRAMRRLGVAGLLDRRKSPQRQRVMAMIAQRILHPESKLATARLMNSSTLADELDLGRIDEDDLYQAMDWLAVRQKKIEKRLARRHLRNGGHVLYDVTSSYYEGSKCPLAKLGYDRDGKKGRAIVVYGVLADTKGVPVALQAYPGNTKDSTTVPDQLEKLRGEFGLENVVLVGDRGMITEAGIEDIKRYPGIGWISALNSDGIRKLVEGNKIQLSLFDERNIAEITSEEYPGQRLVVCRNPLLAQRRADARKSLLESSRKEFERIKREVGRRTKTPLTAGEIGIKVGRVSNKFKVGKHFDFEIEDGRFEYRMAEERIEREAALDGIYVIRTDRLEQELSADDTVCSYKNLCKVEQAFRCMKAVDIMVRPIRHWKEERVRAHLFLCMLTYYVQRYMKDALAELLYQDEDAEELARSSDPVTAREPSEKAKKKKRKKKTEQGFEVHSFPTLLEEMSNISRIRREPTRELLKKLKRDGEKAEFFEYSDPNPLQSRAFELIKMCPVAEQKNG